MWYSGQMHPYMEDGRSVIGFAESEDGIHWKRKERPVMEPGQPWKNRRLCVRMFCLMKRINIIKCGMQLAVIMSRMQLAMRKAKMESIGKKKK